jgi:phosphatidylglycerol:prolipoprotein diacylglycerol transferase
MGGFLTFFPDHTIFVQIGPFAIRWYALAYIAGLVGGWWGMRRIVAADALWSPSQKRPTVVDLDDLLVYAALGVVIGGRLGHVLFYGLPYYAANPLEIVKVWRGGMAFHGGLIGVLVATFLFARSRGLSLLTLFDLFAVVAPFGLCLGRIANFINGELWGRPSDVPWAMVFPGAGPEPRHPSQLYEAGMEGILLLGVMVIVLSRVGMRRPGLLAGLFGIGYALARIVSEFFREPDPDSERLGQVLTMGMALSLPMMLAGIVLVWRALARPRAGDEGTAAA